MRRFVLSCLAAFGAFVAAGPARADFAECVASLRAEASRAGISAKTLDAAFNGLQPDMKVLDLQQRQPEFKTPVWDYVDGLVEAERVAGQALRAGVRVTPPRAPFVTGAPVSGVRICLGSATDMVALRRGLETLRNVMTQTRASENVV